MTFLIMQLLWSNPGNLLVDEGASNTAQSWAGQIEAEMQHSMSPPPTTWKKTPVKDMYCTSQCGHWDSGAIG